MNLSDIKHGNAVKIAFNGRLDTAGVDRVETRFLAATVATGKNTVIDLSGVDFITSMGVRMLVSAARTLSQRKLRMVLFGAQDLVREVLETAAIDTLVATVGTETEAVALIPG